MKHLFALFLLTYFTLTAYAQTPPAWPRNPKTGKVEFSGTLPWPASTKTEAQRRALIRRWYLGKLTDESAQAVAQHTRTAVSPAVLTYDHLPSTAIISSKGTASPDRLAYNVELKPTQRGLTYSLNEFQFTHAADTDLGPELEQVLATDNPADRPALASLRQRLASALASW